MDAEVLVVVGVVFIAAGLVVACARESAQLGEKEGNGVQMFSIKHRAAELQ